MKIALKLFLIVSFIFSFFFFLSKPVNAQLFTPVIPNEILAPKTYDGNTYTNYALIYGFNNFGDGIGWNLIHLKDGGTINLMCGQGNYSGSDTYIACGHRTKSVPGINHSVHPTYYFYDNGEWVSKSGLDVIQIGANDNRANVPSYYILSTVDVAFYNPYKVQYYAWMYGGTGTTYVANTYYPLFSANLNYGFSGVPVVAPTFTYFIEYRDNFVSNSWLRLESSKPAYISASWAEGANLFGFDGGEWELYETDGTQRALLDSSSSYYPPYLYIPDVNTPCGAILRSNYSLRDDNGDFVCRATSNPVVDDIAPPFEGKINFVIEDHDWGVFDWLRVPAKILFDAIDGALVWFNDLWRGLLSQLIPMPDFLSFYGQDISNAFNEKIDIASFTGFIDDLKSLQNENESEMPNLTGSLMGVEVPLIDFAIIKDNISIIRGITTTFVILYIAYFNINAITLILNNKKFLSRE